jgi:hypothetical protein
VGGERERVTAGRHWAGKPTPFLRDAAGDGLDWHMTPFVNLLIALGEARSSCVERSRGAGSNAFSPILILGGADHVRAKYG